jgi:hypothetical protein
VTSVPQWFDFIDACGASGLKHVLCRGTVRNARERENGNFQKFLMNIFLILQQDLPFVNFAEK